MRRPSYRKPSFLCTKGKGKCSHGCFGPEMKYYRKRLGKRVRQNLPGPVVQARTAILRIPPASPRHGERSKAFWSAARDRRFGIFVFVNEQGPGGYLWGLAQNKNT